MKDLVSRTGLQPYDGTLHQPVLPCQPADTAGSVAAHFGFCAVGIEHTHTHIGFVWRRWRQYENKSVRADAEMPVAYGLSKSRYVDLSRIENTATFRKECRVKTIEIHIIVAAAFHFCEGYLTHDVHLPEYGTLLLWQKPFLRLPQILPDAEACSCSPAA